MSKKLKELKLVLENCDAICFEVNEIEMFYFNKIKNRRVLFYNHYGRIDDSPSIDDFIIRIKPFANKEYYEFGIDEFKTYKFERLKHNDITQVELIYDDLSNECFYVRWHEDDEYSNRYQITEVVNEELIITINKKNGKNKNKNEVALNLHNTDFYYNEEKKKQILNYIDRLKNSGLGKHKSLEYLYKYVDNILTGGNIINE